MASGLQKGGGMYTGIVEGYLILGLKPAKEREHHGREFYLNDAGDKWSLKFHKNSSTDGTQNINCVQENEDVSFSRSYSCSYQSSFAVKVRVGSIPLEEMRHESLGRISSL